VPINTPHFPSNWELSAARAASVVRLFTQSGISPTRLKAIGFAEHQPIADNATELGRSKNRRVAIMVLNKPDEKRVNLGLDEKEQQGLRSDDLYKHSSHNLTTSVPKQIPFTSPDASGNDNKSGNSSSGGPKLLQSQADKPPMTTLPLASPRSRVSNNATQNRSTPASRQEKPGDTSQSTVTVKPAEPISLPVLQVLPKSNGD
jgi:hypothetical protein